MLVHSTKFQFLLPLLLWFPGAFAQQVVELNLSSSQSGFVIRTLANNGNFPRQHRGPMLFCDRAAQHSSGHKLSAFGHVLLVQGDSITIKSDSLLYDSHSQQATLYGHVMFQDRRTILTTERLVYNLSVSVAQYMNRARIVDNRTVVTSQQGTYDVQLKQFIFRTNVRLLNGPKSMVADSLRYTTTSQLAVRLMPTSPVGKPSVLIAQQDARPSSDKQIKMSHQHAPEPANSVTAQDTLIARSLLASTIEKTPPLDSIRTQPTRYRTLVQPVVATSLQVNKKIQDRTVNQSVISKPVARAGIIRTAAAVSPPPSTDSSQESDLERELNQKRRFN